MESGWRKLICPPGFFLTTSGVKDVEKEALILDYAVPVVRVYFAGNVV